MFSGWDSEGRGLGKAVGDVYSSPSDENGASRDVSFPRKGAHWAPEKPVGTVEKTRVDFQLDSEVPGITQRGSCSLLCMSGAGWVCVQSGHVFVALGRC